MKGLIWILCAIGCGTVREPQPSAALGDQHVASADVPTRKSGRVQYHMREQLGDLRELQRWLVAGRLAEAKALAFLISRPVQEPRWSVDSARVERAALAVAQASGLAAACRSTPQIAMACATCHQRNAVRAQANPPRRGWVAEEMLEALVTTSDVQWRRALDELASSPATGALARDAIDRMPRDTLATRADVYGRVLATYPACRGASDERR